MEMIMSDEKIKANLYIDGNFTVHIHKYLAKKFGKTIDWDRLIEFIKDRISKEEQKICILKSQFFVGTGIKTTDPERDYLFNSMEHAGITKHATPLRQKVSGGLKEDAVDTNLVFFATRDYYNDDKYDYLVLLAGDSDFVPLLKGLSSEAVKTFIVYIDFEDNELGITQTAQTLLDISNIRENIESLRLERVDEKIKSIFIDYTGSFEKSDLDTSSKNETAIFSKKSIVKNKNSDQKASAPKAPFTKEQLLEAIKEKQNNSCNGKNDFVLLSQVGLLLKTKTGIKLHGKVATTIEKAFPNEFDIDKTQIGAEKIRLSQ